VREVAPGKPSEDKYNSSVMAPKSAGHSMTSHHPRQKRASPEQVMADNHEYSCSLGWFGRQASMINLEQYLSLDSRR
jgi:hypothetical protein